MSSFFALSHAKNKQNRPMFHEVIQKIKVLRFLLRHGVYMT